jgi:hypothetical protein
MEEGELSKQRIVSLDGHELIDPTRPFVGCHRADHRAKIMTAFLPPGLSCVRWLMREHK